MTDGEKMVWAAAFVLRLREAESADMHSDAVVAARYATFAVAQLRRLVGWDLRDWDTESLVGEMTKDAP